MSRSSGSWPRARVAALLALLLVFPAVAEESPGRPDSTPDAEDEPRVPGLRIDEEEPQPPEPAPEEEPLAPAPIVDQTRRIDLELLAKYPGAGARTLIDELVARGDASLPFLISCLDDPNLKIRLAAADALTRLRHPSAYDALKRSLGERNNLARLTPFANALVATDRTRGLTDVAAYLEAPRSQPRRQAADVLMATLTSAELPEVVTRYVDSKIGEARELALGLFARIEGQKYLAMMLDHLGDAHPPAAFLAARTLAKHAGDAELKQLAQMVADFDVRSGPYALLTLVMAEDERGEDLLDPEAERRAIQAFTAEDLLERGVGAIAMVNLARTTEDAEVIKLLDRRVVPVLIETGGGTTYFPDHGVLRELVLRKLATLTGKNFAFDWDAWRQWWLEERLSFVAQRGLGGNFALDPQKTTIRYATSAKLGQPIDLFIAAFDHAEFPGEAIHLTAKDMGALLDGIAYEGFLDLPETIGATDAPGGTATLVISSDGRQRSVTLHGASTGAKGEVFDRVAAQVLDVRYRNQWQRYHDRIAYPDRHAWWLETYHWWASQPSADQGARRLRSNILATIDQLPAGRRAQAFRDLAIADQGAGQPLTKDEAYFALGPFGDGELTNSEAKLIAGMLARAAIPETLSAAVAASSAGRDYDTHALLVTIFAGFGRAAIEPYASHPAEAVRAATAEALGRARPVDARALELLTLRLDDASPLVAASAAFGLGALEDPRGIDLLAARMEKVDRTVQKAMISAIGQIGGARAVEALVPHLSSGDRLIRQTAIAALGETGDANAITPLLAALMQETSPVGRTFAAQALASFSGGAAREAILGELRKQQPPTTKVYIIDTLALLQPGGAEEELLATLRTLAREEQGEVHESAVLALGELGDAQSIPWLIALLERGANPRAVSVLRRLTYQNFSGGSPAAVAAAYRDWWQATGGKSWQWWLVEALIARGHPAVPLYQAVAADETAMSAVPALIEALADERRELREGAARLLTEITTQDFGAPDPTGDELSLAVLAAQWRAWYDLRR